MRKAGNSTACRTDRLGLTGDDCEDFAEILHQLDPRGGSGKFAAQSLKKGRRRRGSRSSLAGRSNRATPGQSGEHKHDVRFHAVQAITEGRARERRGQRSRISASITMGIQFSLAIDSEFAQTLGISGFDLV